MKNPLSQTGYRNWYLFVIGWTLLSLLFVPEVYLYFLYREEAIPWTQTVALTLANAAIALLFVPLIVMLTRRYPVERQTWYKTLPVHIVACLIFSLSHSWLYAMLCFASPGLFHALFARFHPNLLTYWAIVGFTQAMDYFQRYQEREQQLAQAELRLLKSQLHPHFLFNTLNTVSAMMHEDVQAADQTVNCLSELLRMFLDNIGAHEVSLRKELEYVRKYVEIEQARFPDKLKLEIEVDPETLDVLVPNMLLQPFVENSIHHGINFEKCDGIILISAHRVGDRLLLSVSDNGRGLPRESLLKEGLGFKNARSRLKQLYGENHSFRTEWEIEKPGFSVSFSIPFRTASQELQKHHLEYQEYEDPSSDCR